ncbi:unnamed protein product [Soboliphyme baturini]|uniref:Dof-type domain-containing protein n=1 Tax=Soboliphyme baturini TaxID=241478 RepID=A0A183IUX0_9BILA|nr:unnamed protein product [Soboliphyme baturini]
MYTNYGSVFGINVDKSQIPSPPSASSMLPVMTSVTPTTGSVAASLFPPYPSSAIARAELIRAGGLSLFPLFPRPQFFSPTNSFSLANVWALDELNKDLSNHLQKSLYSRAISDVPEADAPSKLVDEGLPSTVQRLNNVSLAGAFSTVRSATAKSWSLKYSASASASAKPTPSQTGAAAVTLTCLP